MPDNKKVIDHLLIIRTWNEVGKAYAYDEMDKKEKTKTVKWIDDALELLKEQEPVEPIPPTDGSDLWKCGNCNHQLFRCTHQRYCEMCGRQVKWKA